ncbi:MAG: M23 family metallopeptidase, partial [Myxococcota bacterium]
DKIAKLRVERSDAVARASRREGVSTELVRALQLAEDAPLDETLATATIIEERATRLGHLDAALEAQLLGEVVVERAVGAASAAGEPEPARLAHHRRYLTRRQRELVTPYVNQVMAIHTALDFQWPVTVPHRITSPFGYRGDPFLKTRRFHNGVDLGVKTGTEIRAAHDGRVQYAAYDGVNGWYLKLTHGYGLTTAYCHNSRLLLGAGDRTRRGEVIALSGSTGRSTGPHLHYIVKMGGRPVDPIRFGER